MAVDIVPFEEIGPEKWDDYVLEHPEGTLFHLSKWKSVVEKSFGHRSFYFGAVEKDRSQEKVIGVMPLFSIKSLLFGHYLVSAPFAEIGGIVADTSETADGLLQRAIETAEALKCDYLELRNRDPIADLPVKPLYVNFKREIYPDLEDNLKAIPRKARRMVRQGEKKGLLSETGHHLLPAFYSLLANNYHRLGTPVFSRRLFENFIDVFGDQSQILIVRKEGGQPVAGVLSFFYKDQVLPYYAGSDFQFRSLAPNDFMYWELLRYAWERGCKVFDYGRSKIDTGSYDFKRHWGFEPTPLAYQYHLVAAEEAPNLSPANPKYRKKIEMWRRLPFFITKILGPPIARYLA